MPTYYRYGRCLHMIYMLSDLNSLVRVISHSIRLMFKIMLADTSTSLHRLVTQHRIL